MRILGIDPGLTGGCAILIVGAAPVQLWDAIDIPTKGEDAKRRVDVLALAKWIAAGQPDHAFIERAQAMPQQGSSSGFIYGRACGALEAAAILAQVPVQFVEAAAWKKHLDLPGAASYAREHDITKGVANSIIKNMVREIVLRVFPDSSELLARRADHGKAEAIAIAMYGADLLEVTATAAA